MKHIINRIAWAFPSVIHEVILKITGYRLVFVFGDNIKNTYYWTNNYQCESFKPETPKVS